VRYAVLSDLHSNLEALTAVLDAADALGIDGAVCLGDLVGYGPDPNEVIDLVRVRAASVVRGNHDHAAVEPGHEAYFNPWGQAAIRWTRKRLTKENRDFLSGLPLAASVSGVRLVHACPSEPETWRYVMDEDDAADEFDAFDEAVCLIGHSHIPLCAVSAGSVVSLSSDDEVPIEDGKRYLINVGSVGQPRDGDPRAAFGVLDLARSTIRRHRVEYDAGATRDKILTAGLPRFLGDRLLRGQ
jgi:diadenosine tetraphosphatase ApaH/serine/threonine PP2A family protein phosphatase